MNEPLKIILKVLFSIFSLFFISWFVFIGVFKLTSIGPHWIVFPIFLTSISFMVFINVTLWKWDE